MIVAQSQLVSILHLAFSQWRLASMAPPRHWPDNIIWITQYSFHASVDAESREFIGSTSQNSKPNGFFAIHKIKDAGHPAYGQYGLFAAKRIPANTHIIDYLGK